MIKTVNVNYIHTYCFIGRKIIEEVPKFSSLQDFNTLNASKSKKLGSDRIKGDSFENEVQLVKPEVSMHISNY